MLVLVEMLDELWFVVGLVAFWKSVSSIVCATVLVNSTVTGTWGKFCKYVHLNIVSNVKMCVGSKSDKKKNEVCLLDWN